MTRIATLFALTVALAFGGSQAVAASPKVGATLPVLEIADRGELTMEGDKFSYVPWTSATNPGKVHIIQYFGATLGDRDVFAPFTDMLQEKLEPGTFHVSTVLNLDAALWGTKGFVESELEKNKTMHPEATMVLDAGGDGVKTWELGDSGTGVIVMDDQGTVKFFKKDSLTEEELASTLELIRSLVGS